MRADEDGQVVLDGEDLQVLEAALAEAGKTSQCRVLVLRGESGAFCRGMDLQAVLACDEGERAAAFATFARCLQHLRQISIPVLCLVDGEAIGGGVGLAAAADVLVATRRSTFALPEVVFGLIPALVLPVLLERLTVQKARRLTVCGLALEAREAHSLGLVDRVVEGGEALEAAERALLRQLLRVHPQAVARVKQYCEQIADLDLSAALEAGTARNRADLQERDIVEAVRTFIDGEVPPWFERYRPT